MTWAPILFVGLYGAVMGALATATIGFTAGGWMTRETARSMTLSASERAVKSVATQYCVERARSDPQSAQVLAELDSTFGIDRRKVIERTGWATPSGFDQPITEVATACEMALGKIPIAKPDSGRLPARRTLAPGGRS